MEWRIGRKVVLRLWKDRLDSVPAAEMSERLPLGRNMSGTCKDGNGDTLHLHSA